METTGNIFLSLVLTGFQMTFSCMRGPEHSATSMNRVALFLWVMGSIGNTSDLRITIIFCRHLSGGCGAAELRRQNRFSYFLPIVSPKSSWSTLGYIPEWQHTAHRHQVFLFYFHVQSHMETDPLPLLYPLYCLPMDIAIYLPCYEDSLYIITYTSFNSSS